VKFTVYLYMCRGYESLELCLHSAKRLCLNHGYIFLQQQILFLSCCKLGKLSIVSDYKLNDRVSIPGRGERIFPVSCVQTGSGAHLSCTVGTGGPFSGAKARPGRDADHSPPSGRAMAQADSRWPLTFALRSVHVGFLVDKVVLGQVFLRVLRFSPVSTISPYFSILVYHLRNGQYVC
jgi:hypothetical protein